jgi:hypothetical protein
MHFQSPSGNNRRYGGDWYLRFGKGEDGYLRLGMDALQIRNGSSGLLPAAGIRIPLPRHQVLEVSYLRDIGTQMLQVQLGGKLVRQRAIAVDSTGCRRWRCRRTSRG